MVLNAMLNLAQTAADLVDHLIALLEIGDDLGVSLPLELELALELALVLIVFALFGAELEVREDAPYRPEAGQDERGHVDIHDLTVRAAPERRQAPGALLSRTSVASAGIPRRFAR